MSQPRAGLSFARPATRPGKIGQEIGQATDLTARKASSGMSSTAEHVFIAPLWPQDGLTVGRSREIDIRQRPPTDRRPEGLLRGFPFLALKHRF